MADANLKKSKDEVNYSPGHPDRRCGLCVHWRQPTSNKPAHCTLVAGQIGAHMWCRLFAPMVAKRAT